MKIRLSLVTSFSVALCCLIVASVFCQQADAATILIDFGRGNGAGANQDGRPTASPDVNGNHWNNFDAELLADPLVVPVGSTLSNLVTTTNQPTSIDLIVTTTFRANGRRNGGLFGGNGPSADLLGDFAIESATEDYFYTEVGGASNLQGVSSLKIAGLNPAATYDFRFFGTRVATDTRTSRYTLTGGNGVFSTDLTTTGTGIGANGYNGNNNTIVGLTGITPNANEEILLDLITTTNNYGYLGIMEITERVIPEPTTGILLACGGLVTMALSRRRSS